MRSFIENSREMSSLKKCAHSYDSASIVSSFLNSFTINMKTKNDPRLALQGRTRITDSGLRVLDESLKLEWTKEGGGGTSRCSRPKHLSNSYYRNTMTFVISKLSPMINLCLHNRALEQERLRNRYNSNRRKRIRDASK